MATIHNVRDQIRTAVARGDYERALSLAQLIRQRFPNDFETTQLVGQIHLENGRYEDARRAFEVVLDVDPENVLARSGLAIVAEEEGDLDEALEQFERAFDMNTSNQQVASEIRRLHSQLSHTRPVDSGSTKHAIARRLLREKKYEAAIPLFEDALRMWPEAVEAAVALAQTLWLARRPREAEHVARRILVRHPDCLKALAVVAGAAWHRGDRTALELLDRTVALNPGNPVARGLFQRVDILFPKISDQIDVPGADGDGPRSPLGGDTDSSPESDRSEGDAPAIADSEPGGGEERLPEDARRQGRLSSRLAAALDEPPSAGDPGTSESPIPSPDGDEGDLAQLDDGFQVGAPDGFAPEMSAEDDDSWNEEIEPIVLPAPDAKGEWVRRETAVGDMVGRQGEAALHVSFARSFESRGHFDLALSEYQIALRLDSSTAEVVAEAAGAIADAIPTDVGARWLLGDALATSGQFRRAMEQYLAVLGGRR